VYRRSRNRPVTIYARIINLTAALVALVVGAQTQTPGIDAVALEQTS